MLNRPNTRGRHFSAAQLSTTVILLLLISDPLLPAGSPLLSQLNSRLQAYAVLLAAQRGAAPGVTLDLRITPTVELSRIARLAGLESFGAKGVMRGEVRIQGSLDDLTLSGRMEGSNVTLGRYANTRLRVDFRAQYSRARGRVLVRSLEIRSPAGDVSASGTLFLDSRTETTSLNATLRNFDILPLTRMLNDTVAVASRATGRAALRWKGNFAPGALSADAQLRLEASSISPAEDILPLSGQADVQVRSGAASIRLSSAEALGTGFEGSLVLPSPGAIRADVKGNASNMAVFMTQLAQFLGREDLFPTQVAGPATFQARATGQLANPAIVLTLQSSALQISDFSDVSVEANGRIADSRLEFTASVAPRPGAALSVRGSIGLGGKSPPLDIDVTTNQMPAGILLPLLGIDVPVDGILEASLRLEGTTDDIQGSGSLSAKDLQIYQASFGRLDAAFRISGNQIRTTGFRLVQNPGDLAGGFIDAQASYDLRSGQFTLQSAGTNLRFAPLVLPGGVPFSGTVSYTMSGSGTKDAPVVNAELTVVDAEVSGRNLGAAAVTAALRDGLLNLDLRLPGLPLTARATIRTEKPFPASFEAEAQQFDLALLAVRGPGGSPLTGKLDLKVAGSGNLDDPLRGSLSAVIQNAAGQLGGIELATRGPVQAQYRDGLLEIVPEAAVTIGESSVRIEGTIPLLRDAPAGEFRALSRLDLKQIGDILAGPQGAESAGEALVDVTVSGTRESLDARGSLTVSNGSFNHPKLPAPLSGVSIQAELQKDTLVLQQARASLKSGSVSLTGEFPLGILAQRLPYAFLQNRKPEPARFVLQLTNLELDSLAKLPQGVNGLVSLTATGTAGSLDASSVAAEITFSDLRFTAGEAVIEQNGQSAITADNGILIIRRLELTGPETRLQASGSAGFVPNSGLNLRLEGTTNAALLSFLAEDLIVAGPVQVQVSVLGTTREPRLAGTIELQNVQASMRDPDIALDSVNGRLNFTGNQIALEGLTGTLNGGSMRAAGTLSLVGGRFRNLDISANLRDIFLEFPKGLRSFSSGTLTATSSGDLIVVGGKVRVLESSYREPIEIGGEIMRFLQGRTDQETVQERSELLERVRFNVAVETVTPLIVRNNLAELEANARLRIVGTYYSPSVVGSINIEEGGSIFLNERTYYVRQGVVNLNNQARIEPDLNILAETTVNQYDITMQISGTPDRLTTQLSSEPALSQADIVSVLLTGRETSQLSGQEFQLAQAQALSLIAGQAGQQLASGAREVFGITTFRLEPSFIASETSDPGARVTLGQDITSNFSLGYSMNLVDPGDQVWIAKYDLIRRFTTQALKQVDNTYRMGFTHQLQFGVRPDRRRRSARRPEIGNVQFEAGPLLSEEVLKKRFDQDPGDRYEFPDVQKGLDNLKETYSERNRLEARIRLERERAGRTVNLKVNIDPGPEVEIVFAGTEVPQKLAERVRQIWEEGVFDIARLSDSADAIRRHYVEEGYLQAAVTHDIDVQPDRKTVRFDIAAGRLYSEVNLDFPGASEMQPAELETALRDAGLYLSLLLDPGAATRYLENYYRRRGYLDAVISPPAPYFNESAGIATITVPVSEGPRFLIGDLNFEGNRAFDDDRLWMLVPISSGSIYSPELILESEDILEEFYRNNGFTEVIITYRVNRVSERARADITFKIDENARSIIREIRVDGNRLTSERLVRRLLTFDVGDVLDFSQISKARSNLYEIGIYTFVDFETEELPGQSAGPEKPVIVRVVLQELSTYRLDYGGYYDTERGPGGIFDIVRRSPFGTASIIGLRGRYDSDLRLARLYYSQPHIKNLRLKTNISAILQRETSPGFSARRIGVSLIQQKELPKDFFLDYGYRYDHVRWNGIPRDPTLYPSDVPVARATGTLWRDTRDSILDATRGEFMSNSLEYGPTWLGSEIGFIKYFGQYFKYVGLDRLLLKPQQDEKTGPQRPRLVYATAVRLGIAKAFNGQDVISPDRFYAGGGTTMRGFKQDLLGPTEIVIDPDSGQPEERPLGGEGLLLLNNELRFPIYRILGGVGFVDVGNVYRTLSDFDLGDLRVSAGIGLRVRVRFILLRFDWGFKLDRRPGETPSTIFFSIGQAF